MINPKNELFRWGPIDARPFFADYWYRGFTHFKKDYPPGYPPVYNYFEKERLTVVMDNELLYDAGEATFKKYVLDDKKFKKTYHRWKQAIGKLKKLQNHLAGGECNKNDITRLFLMWDKIYGSEFWNVGSVSEMANWGGERMLSRELAKRIKDKIDFNFALERLSAPERYSFYQLEELDLLAIKNIKNKSTFEKRLRKHQQKYFWLLNSYHGARILPINFFRKRINGMSEKESRKKMAEIKRLIKKVKKHKLEVVKKFNLPKSVLKISQRLAFCIWWQDERKSHILQANQFMDLMLNQISRLSKISKNNLFYYTVIDMENLIIENVPLSSKEIVRRKKLFLAVWDGKKAAYISGQKAQTIFRPYIKSEVKKNITEIEGMVVNRGKAKGRVRIIHTARESSKMKKGDILVTSMTTPDFIMALRKSTAVITDEGGMTCHAAIVSRELGIPGIVGTRIATKVLKDGDLVEVDAERGIVKIIKE